MSPREPKPKPIREWANILTMPDGQPIFSILLTLEEVEFIAQGALSEQLIEHCQQQIREYHESVQQMYGDDDPLKIESERHETDGSASSTDAVGQR